MTLTCNVVDCHKSILVTLTLFSPGLPIPPLHPSLCHFLTTPYFTSFPSSSLLLPSLSPLAISFPLIPQSPSFTIRIPLIFLLPIPLVPFSPLPMPLLSSLSFLTQTRHTDMFTLVYDTRTHTLTFLYANRILYSILTFFTISSILCHTHTHTHTVIHKPHRHYTNIHPPPPHWYFHSKLPNSLVFNSHDGRSCGQRCVDTLKKAGDRHVREEEGRGSAGGRPAQVGM